MARRSTWYPPGQVCCPPELPEFLKNVYHLKPTIGVPSDDEVIGIHTVLQAARKASDIPGMHDPGLLMSLSDHLFNAQMARYRSKYSLITFPSDARYTPPTLPAHISVKLGPISGAPTDEEIIQAQEALRCYQQFSHAPSMFDGQVNMELSQHLFDIQMARYMRRAGETQPILESHAMAQLVPTERPHNMTEQTTATNNVGTGEHATVVPQTSHSIPGIDGLELAKQSNQLAERFNQLLERTNELMERCVLERFTQFLERTAQPTEQPNRLSEQFNQLFERFSQMVEQSSQSGHRANELAEKSNELAEKANQLAEQICKPVEKLGDLMKNINRVLMGIQHAIVRSQKGNTLHAVDCLVNEKGQTPMEALGRAFRWNLENSAQQAKHHLPVRIGGSYQAAYLYNVWLGRYLRFYGIGEGLRESPTSTVVIEGREQDARIMLSDYMSSCLG